VEPSGLEQGQQYSTFGDPASCAAEISALNPNSGHIDSDLAEVEAAWPTLPDAVKADILAVVRASRSSVSGPHPE
jgi:hypothetical protein